MKPTPDNPGLARNRITLLGALTQSIGFMGPVFSVAALLPLVVGESATGRGAGAAAPVAILIAGIGIGGVAWIIAQYAKRIHLCGSLYDYISRSAGPRFGLVSGWLYYGAMLILGVATFLLLGGLTQTFLQTILSVNVPWGLLALGYVALITAIVVIGVQISIRAQLVLALVSMAVVLVFSLIIIGKGGHGGHSLSATPFNPVSIGALNLLYGVLYGINMFIGFESAANLAEETANPKRDVPRAVLFSLILVGAYFLVTAYAQDIGFGLNATAWESSGFPLQSLASGGEFGSSVFGDIMSVIVIFDVLAVTIGVSVAVTRGMLAMARAGRLPRALATVHRRYRTPHRCAAVLAITTVIAIVAVWAGNGIFSRATGQPGVLQPQWSPMFGWMAGFGGTGLAVMYLIVSAVGIKGLWGEVNRAKLLLAGLAGSAVAAGAVFGSIYKAPSPLNSVPWALLVWIALGAGWSYIALRRPEKSTDVGAPVAQAAPAGE